MVNSTTFLRAYKCRIISPCKFCKIKKLIILGYLRNIKNKLCSWYKYLRKNNNKKWSTDDMSMCLFTRYKIFCECFLILVFRWNFNGYYSSHKNNEGIELVSWPTFLISYSHLHSINVSIHLRNVFLLITNTSLEQQRKNSRAKTHLVGCCEA